MPSSRRPRDRRLAALVAGVVLAASAAYVAATFRWAEALALLARADLRWLLGAASGAILVYWVLRAARWHLLLPPGATRGGFIDAYLCSTVALSLSVLTPLQSGEALKVELMRRHAGLERAPGYGAFLIERSADLYAIVALAVLALAWHGWVTGLATAAALAMVPVAAFVALHRVTPRGAFGRFLDTLRRAVSSPSALARVLATTFLAWGAVALGWQASLVSVGIELDVHQILSVVAAITLATLASLIPGGLGIAEAGTAGMLGRFGIDAAQAQAGALALRAFSILVIALGGLHLLLLKLRAHARHGAKEFRDHPLP